MKYLICILFLVFTSSVLTAQLEKIGVYGGTALVVHSYKNKSAFFSLRHRVGAMTSFYGDQILSFETGLLVDYHQISNRRKLNFNYNDGLEFSLTNHKFVNIGLPISVTMRTNTTRNCVTYFKLSLVNLATISDDQTVNNRQLSDRLSTLPQSMSSVKNGLKYYSTDIDFGFGTFWYIKKFGAKLCLEPKATVFQYRNSMYANHLPNREIVIAQNKLLASLGFEITIYKDLF